MSSVYEHAYLWEKGRSSLHNDYTLAMESVTMGNGEACMVLICDDGVFTRKTVGWFFRDALLILRDYGICSYLRKSFLRKVAGKAEGDYVLLLLMNTKQMIQSRGEKFEIMDYRRKGIFVFDRKSVQTLGKDALCRSLQSLLKHHPKEEDIFVRLKEFARRCKSRGLRESMAAVYVRKRRKPWPHAIGGGRKR